MSISVHEFLTVARESEGVKEVAMWKAIIQWVIRELIYDCDKYVDTSRLIVSKRMLDVAEVKYYQYERTGRKIEIGL